MLQLSYAYMVSALTALLGPGLLEQPAAAPPPRAGILVLASHSAAPVRRLCTTAILLDQGSIAARRDA